MRAPVTLGESGLVVLDASWGEIAPMTLAEGVRAVGELEVIDHLEGGLALIDSRLPAAHSEGTIPGAQNIPHAEAAERIDELDPRGPTVFFCNGPQCGASPDAIYSLLAEGFPPRAILYYRGGLHDWVSLGLPLVIPDQS
jgi:rhodanese-related sulfurtransferase